MPQYFAYPDHILWIKVAGVLERKIVGLEATLNRARQELAEVVDQAGRLRSEATHLMPVSKAGTSIHLTPAERRIADLLVEGKANSQIAQELNITVATVKTHVRTILRKLDIRSRWQISEALMLLPAGAAAANELRPEYR